MNPRLLVVAAVLALVLLPVVQAAPTITAVDPEPGGTVRVPAPLLTLRWSDPAGVDANTAQVTLDGEVYDPELGGLTANATGLSLQIPTILPLREGNHTLVVSVANSAGEQGELTLAFVVNFTVPPAPPKELPVGLIFGAAGAGLLLLGIGATVAYQWARRTRNFTLRKHFLRHPGQLKFIVLYIPSGAAVLLTFGALFFVSTLAHPPRYAAEEVFVAGAALAFGPFGLSSLRGSLRTRAYERAFAQFLFELADAVRGGINPTKAVQELAKTGEGVLKRPLQQAADVLRLGRPMDEALRAMVAQMGSPLVLRYASLVGEASSMGGSVAGVLQRAAKDMDDLVKIKAERRRALRQPVFTMYMAFAVLLLMVLQVIGFAPNIGDLDLSALGVGGEATAQVAKMPLPLMQERFFHLLLVNAAGAGLLVGFFTEGRARNGILHALVMVGVAAVVYPLFTL